MELLILLGEAPGWSGFVVRGRCRRCRRRLRVGSREQGPGRAWVPARAIGLGVGSMASLGGWRTSVREKVPDSDDMNFPLAPDSSGRDLIGMSLIDIEAT